MRTVCGKHALVTGAASGIGRAIALALADRGADLFLLDVDLPGLADVAWQARRKGVRVTVRCCDLAVPSEISESVDALMRSQRPVDVLVNNAGIAYYGPTHLMSASQWNRLLAVNLLAPIQLTRELLPSLLDRPEAHVLNVSSIAGLVASGRLAAYHVSKYGLIGFSESLRAEYGPRGLGVTALCPGLVKTDLFQTAEHGHPDKPLPKPPDWLCASPECVARRAVRAILRDEGLVLVTPMAHVLWFLKRLSPGLLDYCQRFRRRRTRPRKHAGPVAIEPETDGSPQAEQERPFPRAA